MAYEFTASSSQYLSTASAPATTTPLTLACWFRPTNVADTRYVLSLGAANSNHAHSIYHGTNNLFAVSTDTASNQSTRTILGLSNTWIHACAVFSANNNRQIYANGTAGTANTSIRNPANIAAFRIGSVYFGGAIGFYANANIAEVGIWNAALTADEIASLAKGITCDKVRPQNLVFYAPLVRDLVDTKGGLTITNNNTATVANHPRVYA
jgi:hypothetical protein